jgi:adenosine deaminase
MIDGLRAAKTDLKVSCLLIPSIDRGLVSSSEAVEMVQEVLDDRRDEVVGIGLDGPERAGPAERFVDAYQLAGRHGLKRTAHVCEDNQTLAEAPPANYLKCRDLLGCDRLDHGYNLLADEDMIRQARADGLYFTGCPVTSVKKNLIRRKASLRTMAEAGLRVTLNTDDPTMFHTDIGDSYLSLDDSWDYGPDMAQMFSLNGVAASWLGEAEKASLWREFEQEIAALRAHTSTLPHYVEDDSRPTACDNGKIDRG